MFLLTPNILQGSDQLHTSGCVNETTINTVWMLARSSMCFLSQTLFSSNYKKASCFFSKSQHCYTGQMTSAYQFPWLSFQLGFYQLCKSGGATETWLSQCVWAVSMQHSSKTPSSRTYKLAPRPGTCFYPVLIIKQKDTDTGVYRLTWQSMHVDLHACGLV